MNTEKQFQFLRARVASGIAIAFVTGLGGICFHELWKPAKFETGRSTFKTPEQNERTDTVRAMKSSHFRNSFEARLQIALSANNPTERSMSFGVIFQEWLEADQEAALAYLQKSPRNSSYTQGLFLALPYVAGVDPERAVKLAGTMAEGKEELSVFNILFARITEKDPAEAVKLLDFTEAGESRENALRAIAGVWAKKDASMSLDWAKSLAEPHDRVVSVQSLLVMLIENEPVKAISLAMQELPEAAREETLSKALRALEQVDPESLRDWVLQFPQQLPTALLPEVARTLAASSPQDALKWLGDIVAGDSHDAALLTIVKTWSSTDPTFAKQMISANLPEADQALAAAVLARSLAVGDPVAAIDWSDSLESEKARESAFLGAVSSWAQNSPEAAAQWAATLPAGDSRRIQAIEASLSYWVLSDVSAARRYLETLPAKERTQAQRLFPSEKPVG